MEQICLEGSNRFDAKHTSEIGLSTTIDCAQENKENATLIWFDPVTNTTDDIEKIKEDIKNINNFVLYPTDITTCIDYMKSITEEKILLIISGKNAFKLLPSIINLPQLDSVFIFPENREEVSRLCDDYFKIVGIFDNANDLIISIKENVKHINRHLEVFSSYNQYQQGTRDLSKQLGEFLW